MIQYSHTFILYTMISHLSGNLAVLPQFDDKSMISQI